MSQKSNIFCLTSARRGFTLIELLVVMAIIGILATLGISNFASARIKARDTKRKSDLSTITKALEAYANDHQSYPTGTAGNLDCTAPATCAWGGPFQDANGTLYAATLPADDNTGRQYYYQSAGGTSYTLYTALENEHDPAFDPSLSVECGPDVTCNYKVTSTNLTP